MRLESKIFQVDLVLPMWLHQDAIDNVDVDRSTVGYDVDFAGDKPCGDD